MAEVFRPVYTAINPKTGKKVRRKSPTWWIRFYDPSGRRHKVKGYSDRAATVAKATDLERNAERLDAGLVDPTDRHAKRPLAEHAEDFRRYLAAKGNTAEYVGKVLYRLTAVLDECRFVRISEIQASALVEFLARLRQGDKAGHGKSIKTANDYLSAAKGFTRWLWRDKRTTVDLLAGLSKLANGETDIRHARRDFTPEELGRLLDAARRSPRAIRCLSGIDRHFLYLTACATGFRASELASMLPESFNLDAEVPTAKVQAACSKNRREAVQPLPLDVAKALRDYLAIKPAGLPVWPGKWKSRAFLMIQGDLKEARAKWLKSFEDARQRTEAEQSDFLAYQDAEGRYADFPALRHSFITMVGKAGVSAREHQDLARHSTYALTSRYSHSRFYDLAAAVQSLPIPTASGPGRENLSATGTDGKSLGPFLGPQSALLGDFERQAETQKGHGEKGHTQQKTLETSRFPRHFQGCDSELSNMEPRGIEPLTSALRTLASHCTIPSVFQQIK